VDIAHSTGFTGTGGSPVERLAAVLTEERTVPIGSPAISTPCHRQINLPASLIYN
jgi:hypothetical protein